MIMENEGSEMMHQCQMVGCSELVDVSECVSGFRRTTRLTKSNVVYWVYRNWTYCGILVDV